MEITPEILDENLKELLTSVMVYTDDEQSIAAILYTDGYVNLTATSDGDVCMITPRGRAFIASGGYVAVERARKREEEKM